ncbi:protein rep, partial [Salinivibrio sp. SS3]|uniref:protein rep n=1 Tax=Salinivibrio sp. SS3 TaxID=1895021 RepID=UPI00159F1408
LEVTYNGDRDDYHPHYHVLVCVPSGYFKKNYIKQERWLELWQEATKYPHITQVDVRAIKPNPKRPNSDDISSAAAEVGKYATKPSNYVVKGPDGNYYAFPKVVEQLADSIRGRKLVAFGGLMLEYSKNLGLVDVESDSVDLINVGEDSAEITAVMVKIFHWNIGLRNYVN